MASGSVKEHKKKILLKSLEETEEPEFQIAPMIDVLLVLLMFFMANITMESRAKIKLELAEAANPNETKKDVNLGEAIINIEWNPEQMKAQYYFGEFPVDLTNISELLSTSKNNFLTLNPGGTFRVLIRSSKDVEYREVSSAMRECARANIPNVIFSVLEAKK
jgi:biopolymer transport protein ExbD